MVWLGDRSGLTPDDYARYVDTGTSHILAISGIHVSIVFVTATAFLEALTSTRRRASVLALLLVWLFALMAGGRAPALRAAIMFTMYVLADFARRERDAPTALSIAALMFTLWRPDILFDAGFQLSFLSVASILLFLPHFSSVLERVPYYLRQPLAMPVAVLVLPLPMAAYHYNSISLAAPLANLMVVPLLGAGLWLLWLSGRLSWLYRRRDRPGDRLWCTFHAAAVHVVQFSETVGEEGRAVPSQLSGVSHGGEEKLQAVGPSGGVEEHSLSPGRSPHGDRLPYFVQRVRVGQVMCWMGNAFCTEHAGQAVGLKDAAAGHGQREVREADVGRARGLEGGNERPDDGASGPVPEGRDRSLSCASGGDDGLSPSRNLRYGCSPGVVGGSHEREGCASESGKEAGVLWRSPRGTPVSSFEERFGFRIEAIYLTPKLHDLSENWPDDKTKRGLRPDVLLPEPSPDAATDYAAWHKEQVRQAATLLRRELAAGPGTETVPAG